MAVDLCWVVLDFVDDVNGFGSSDEHLHELPQSFREHQATPRKEKYAISDRPMKHAWQCAKGAYLLGANDRVAYNLECTGSASSQRLTRLRMSGCLSKRAGAEEA
jgi:hypothetical protein